jgi:hypothetical protein
MSPDKKKIQKIFNQIDKLAVKGKEQVYEYNKLIDDLVAKGDYNYLELTLFYSYQINITDYSSLYDVKKKTWEEILFQTNTPVSKKIKKVLDTKGVYQMGYDIYSDSIGNIDITVSSPLSSTYSNTSSTQSVSLTKNGNNIYLDTNDNDIYNIDIYYAQWEGNTPIPTTVSLLQSISIKKPYEWSFIGVTASSTFTTFYSPIRPNLSPNDKVRISGYDNIFKVKSIIDSNYWQTNINGILTNNSSGVINLYPTISDSIQTEIPTTQGGTYLIKTNMRSHSSLTYRELNYKVNIERSYLLGSILEIDRLSDDSKYYLQNKQYAKVIGTRVTYLEVTKLGATSSLIVNDENPQASEETNLVNRYKIAVEYLLS